MADSISPTDQIAARVRALRQQRGYTVKELAAKCRELGAELSASVLTNLEIGRREGIGRRRVTVEELLVLAQALDVPPVQLVVPLDGRTDLAITPKLKMRSWEALLWITGEDEPSGDRERRRRWREASGPVHQTRAFFTHYNAVARHETGDPAKFNAELRELARVIDAMTFGGIVPPTVPVEWLDLMRSEGWLQHPDEVPIIKVKDGD